MSAKNTKTQQAQTSLAVSQESQRKERRFDRDDASANGTKEQGADTVRPRRESLLQKTHEADKESVS